MFKKMWTPSKIEKKLQKHLKVGNRSGGHVTQMKVGHASISTTNQLSVKAGAEKMWVHHKAYCGAT